MLDENSFVSLNEIRRWSYLVSSDVLGYASSGVILSNGEDICLGGFNGQLSILSGNSIYEIASNAHSKEIVLMKTNRRENAV